MVGLKRMSDYRGVGLERYHCMYWGLPSHVRVHGRDRVCMCLHMLFSSGLSFSKGYQLMDGN